MNKKIQELREIITNITGENYGKYLISDIVLSYFDIYKSIDDGEILNSSEINDIRKFDLKSIIDKAFNTDNDDGLEGLSLELILMKNEYAKLRSIYQKYKVELSIILDAYKTKFAVMEEDKFDDLDDLIDLVEDHFKAIYKNHNLVKDSMDYIYFILPKRYTKAKLQNQLEVILNLISLDKLEYPKLLDMTIKDSKPLYNLDESDRIESVENFIEQLKLSVKEKEVSFEVKRIEEKGYVLYDAIDKIIITLESYDRIFSAINSYLLIYGKERIAYYKYIDRLFDLDVEELGEISYEHYSFFENMIENDSLAYKDDEILRVIDEMLVNHKDYADFSSKLFLDSASFGIQVDNASDLASKISDIVIDRAENKAIRRMRMNLVLCELPRNTYDIVMFIEEVRFFLKNASDSEYANFRNEFIEFYERNVE